MDEMITRKEFKKDLEVVLDCVMPYIQDNQDLNSVSLVSNKFFDIDSRTRKHVTLHVHYLPDPRRLGLRFPNLESLTLKSYSHEKFYPPKCHVPVTPWIHQIALKLKCLKSLSIRNMVVSDSDLRLLAATRGPSLQSLEIRGCKLFTDDGLIHIARCGKDLRSLSLQENDDMENDYMPDGKWLCELSLCNSVMESLDFHAPFNFFDVEDVERLAKNCSNSLVSLDIFPRNLSSYRQVFKHAKKLHHFGIGIVHEDADYSDVEFPSNIRALRIMELREASFPYLLPYLNQLRELDIECGDFPPNCLCFLIKRCPNLEVLVNQDKCGDEGLQVIAQFCKKLRKLNHRQPVTHVGLIALVQGCLNLTHLKVCLSKTSNEVLECVGTHLKNLCDFRIWMGTEDATTDSLLDNGIRAMLMGCRKLEKLDIGLSIGGLTDVGLGYIGRYGNNLKYLSLCNTGDSDVGLLELSKGCLKLRKLRLRCCPFSEQAIATFTFNIHSLRYIRVARDHHPHLLLTRPMLSAEVLTKLYVKLAEKLHRLAVQLAEDGSDVESESESVKITYVSSRPRATDDIDIPLVRDLVAKGIQKEEYDTVGESSETLLEIIVRIPNVESPFATAISEVGDIRLQGRVKDGLPHLTKVGAFEVDLILDGHILLCRQVDGPSTISSVTNILEEEIISINSMSVGKPAPKKQTVMVIGMDEKPSDEALKKIGEIPAVEELVFLAL